MKKLFVFFLSLLLFSFSFSSVLSEESFLSHQLIELSLSVGTRTGYYTGSAKDGIPNGYGIFESQNNVGQKWMYVGEFEDGVFSGKGTSYWIDFCDSESGTYKNGILDTGTQRFVELSFVFDGTFGTGERTTFTGNVYNENGALIFSGSVVDSIFTEGTLYNNKDGSVVASGTFGEGFKNFIENHYIGGYLY